MRGAEPEACGSQPRRAGAGADPREAGRKDGVPEIDWQDPPRKSCSSVSFGKIIARSGGGGAKSW